jgi:hypothetical protein
VPVQLHREAVHAAWKRRGQLIPATEHFTEPLQLDWAKGPMWDHWLIHADALSLWLARSGADVLRELAENVTGYGSFYARTGNSSVRQTTARSRIAADTWVGLSALKLRGTVSRRQLMPF